MARSKAKRRNDTLKYMVVGILVSVGIFAFTRWILPMIFGVSFTTIIASASNKLSGFGGILGGVLGYVSEQLVNFSVYVIEPLFNLNPFAIIGFFGWVSFVTVITYNTINYADVWR